MERMDFLEHLHEWAVPLHFHILKMKMQKRTSLDPTLYSIPAIFAWQVYYFETYTRNNILATQKLLEYYKELDLGKFVFASSSSVYGNAKELPIREDAPKNPFSPYGVTKLAAENLCSLYSMNYGTPV